MSASLLDCQLLWRVIYLPLDVNEAALQQHTVQRYSAGMLLFKDYALVMYHT